MKKVSNRYDNLTRLLALTRAEVAVISCINVGISKSVADITRSVRLPRMTVHTTLISLEERGIVCNEKIGKRKTWRQCSESDIRSRISDAFQPLVSIDTAEINKEESSLKIFRNKDNLFKVYESLYKLKKGERVIAIQPPGSAIQCVEKMGWSEIEPGNFAIRDRGIIIESLLTDDYYPKLFKYIHDNESPRVARDLLKGFVGRVADVVFVKGEHINADTELIIMKGTAYLLNWKDEIGVAIKNEQVIELLKSLFYLARGYGRKVDQNAYINDLTKRLAVSGT